LFAGNTDTGTCRIAHPGGGTDIQTRPSTSSDAGKASPGHSTSLRNSSGADRPTRSHCANRFTRSPGGDNEAFGESGVVEVNLIV
jgi:hypothetical protein